jgi:hypothetical protein
MYSALRSQNLPSWSISEASQLEEEEKKIRKKTTQDQMA